LYADGCNDAAIARQMDMTPAEVRDDCDRIRQVIKLFKDKRSRESAKNVKV